jgi:hypothetical protein
VRRCTYQEYFKPYMLFICADEDTGLGLKFSRGENPFSFFDRNHTLPKSKNVFNSIHFIHLSLGSYTMHTSRLNIFF